MTTRARKAMILTYYAEQKDGTSLEIVSMSRAESDNHTTGLIAFLSTGMLCQLHNKLVVDKTVIKMSVVAIYVAHRKLLIRL